MDKKREKAESKKTLFSSNSTTQINKFYWLFIPVLITLFYILRLFMQIFVFYSVVERECFLLSISRFIQLKKTRKSALLKAATATKKKLSIWALLRVFLRTSPIERCCSADLKACPFRHHKYATLFPHQAFLFASLCKFPYLVPNLFGVHNTRHITELLLYIRKICYIIILDNVLPVF